MHVPGRLFTVFLLGIPFASTALPQALKSSTTNPSSALCKTGGLEPSCNGISVGRPKVFDNRSLTLKLEALRKSLQQQQTANATIDLKSVMSALANTQGLTQSEVSTVVSALVSPTASSTAPSAPTFDSFATLPSGFNPSFGPSASDLLNDQINLNYQIINLQMVLERALSDRLAEDCKETTDPRPNCTRLQTVLGFNVSIDPPRIANDAVAVVEVSLPRPASSPPRDPDSQPKDPNLALVALMPQEKTYNAAALSSSSHAYSGAVVANAFQVSGGYRKRNQTFYVYRDTDTLAYERMTADGALVFGWMFRPVLGRRSVSPGFRQMFAVLSLPQVDCDHQEMADNTTQSGDKKSSKSDCTIQLKPTVRTYWKKYDRATQTSFEAHDANTSRNFWYGLSATLGRPQIFDRSSYVNEANYASIPVYVHSSTGYEEDLRPVIEDVKWRSTGEKSVLVSVTGRNFFTNTQVKLGDSVFSADNKNLIINSDESFDIVASFDQLTSGPSSILGRYGLSVPLVAINPPENLPNPLQHGFQIDIRGFKIGPVIDGYRTLEIPLGQRLDNNAAYSTAKTGIADLQYQLSKSEQAVQETESKLASKQRDLANLQSGKQPNVGRARLLQNEINGLHDDLVQASTVLSRARVNLNDAGSRYLQQYGVKRSALVLSELPIVSINGTALRMPYAILDSSDPDAPTFGDAMIKATFPDSLISSGAALIQVSWPFQNPALWTDTLEFTDPNDQFKVERVSATTIIIRRESASGFAPIREEKCWTFVAGDTSVRLPTDVCPYVARPTPKPVKGKPAPKPDPGPPVQKLRYISSVTVDDKATLPPHAVLLAPDGGHYTLTIPDFPDKKADTTTKPIEMKQGDSTWIPITLKKDKTAVRVEANGLVLPKTQWREVKPDTKTPPNPKNSPPETIEVEITRALTAKSGSIQVTVFDAADANVARQTVTVACNQCSEKKGDQ